LVKTLSRIVKVSKGKGLAIFNPKYGEKVKKSERKPRTWDVGIGMRKILLEILESKGGLELFAPNIRVPYFP